MSTGTLLAIVIGVVVVVVLIALVLALFQQRRVLRERFGSEYERTVDDADSRLAAEREFSTREKRHDKTLPDRLLERCTRDWDDVQHEFVDRPDDAVHGADRLVTSLMQARGHPTGSYDQQLKDLSGEHGRTLEHYRTAHEIDMLSAGHYATTEQLRSAMVHYRSLFDELLLDGGQTPTPRPDTRQERTATESTCNGDDSPHTADTGLSTEDLVRPLDTDVVPDSTSRWPPPVYPGEGDGITGLNAIAANGTNTPVSGAREPPRAPRRRSAVRGARRVRRRTGRQGGGRPDGRGRDHQRAPRRARQT
ncbi:hypothetical protein [Streptomyces cellostaticus]|uniref:hypothetical protein n=1 Tax=Streptomyces cellostaticus TaxID=67285 RepID=UPI0008379EAF|nr:hypothetical protein [Streptomyces cellostaticus]GHI02773.1 hypothetical protein Scel_10940 [Streptomyces cellostaticus]